MPLRKSELNRQQLWLYWLLSLLEEVQVVSRIWCNVFRLTTGFALYSVRKLWKIGDRQFQLATNENWA